MAPPKFPCGRCNFGSFFCLVILLCTLEQSFTPASVVSPAIACETSWTKLHFVSLFTFHPSEKQSITHFIHISTLWCTQHAHSFTFGSAKRGITPLLIALFFHIFCNYRFPFVFDQCCWTLTTFTLFDSRSIMWM